MSTTVQQRIDILVKLGEHLSTFDNPNMQTAIRQAHHANKWFTPENIEQSLTAIRDKFLNRTILQNWVKQYDVAGKHKKTVGLILAGNIPLVGFHDMLCVYLSGHKALLKYSSKDKSLIEYIVSAMIAIDRSVADDIVFVERLADYEAVIATGSNNSSRYFEQYFSHVPNIIRKNRNAVAVIHGDETAADFKNLGLDIFTYFGLGCRNVSKLYVPKGYKFDDMLQVLHDEFKELVLHHKYKNNFDYNHALFMLNKDEFLMSGSLLVRKSTAIPSRISSINYEEYEDIDTVAKDLASYIDLIQCIVSNKELEGLETFKLGEAQQPTITDYADGVDTMQFLTDLSK